ncbi:TonB-dependent receptor plug domain-containing protein [Thalassolituus maritimus]|uniref:TonB-dependent receptor plug domain-containing protein n=1 Tax=Thalassolituus maritimus TaxID=484498 RepID=UPI00158A37B3|nr:TonB-dependent receptor [Thalassolituus maritimus]
MADVPVRTLVMESKTIQKLHSRDIRDALRMLPGIQLREIHGKTGEEVQLQGLNGDRVLILVDGLPVSATTGSTVDTSQLGALDIEQIEVIPGAASSLYGSAAMGGVINIITRQAPEKTGGRVSLQAGSFSSDRELSSEVLPQRHALISGHTEVSGVSVTALIDRRISSEFDLDTDTYPTQGFDGTKTQYKAGVSNRRAEGRLQWQLNAEKYEEDLENRRLTNAGFKGSKTEQLDRTRFTGELALADNHGEWKAQALSENQTDDTAQLNNDATIPAGNLWREADYNQHKWSAQRQQSFGQKWGHDLQLVAGIEGAGESLSQNKTEILLSDEGAAADAVVEVYGDYYRVSTPEVESASRDSLEAFASLTATRTSHNGNTLEWAPGVRVQNDSDFGGYVSPGLSSRQSLPLGQTWQLQLRESLGAGYRVPNLKDRYYVFDHSVNGYMVLGNPDLTPESSRSFQLSANFTDQSRWNIEASAFFNRLYDLIEAEDSGESLNNGQVVIYRYENIQNARTTGAEMATQYSGETLSLRLSYGWLKALNLDTDQPLINRAPHHIKGLLTAQWTDAWDTTLTLDWQNGMVTGISDDGDLSYSRPIARVDLKTGFRLYSDLLLFGGINNLTDNVRDPSDSYDRRPSEGRFPYVGLNLSF